MEDKEMVKRMGWYCKKYREDVLNLTLTDFSDEVNDNMKNIHAFEYGRANNIKYLTYYYKMSCDLYKDEFLKGLFKEVL